MPTIARFGKLLVQVYSGEHGLPHFHIAGPAGRVAVSIETLEILAGDLPRRTIAPALAWAAVHREMLMVKWLELNE